MGAKQSKVGYISLTNDLVDTIHYDVMTAFHITGPGESTAYKNPQYPNITKTTFISRVRSNINTPHE